MLRIMSLVLFAGTAIALHGCGDTTCTTGEQQCSGDQIQTCLDDGTWGDAEDCAETGTVCSSGHEGMEYVHCMAHDHD